MRIYGALVCLLLTTYANATLVVVGLGPERDFAAKFLKSGREPAERKCLLQIRVEAIEDDRMIEAIREGAKRGPVYLLVDRPTEHLFALLASAPTDLKIRWAIPSSFGSTAGEKWECSAARIVGKVYTAWYGPSVWHKGNYRKDASLVLESGLAPWQQSPQDAEDFFKEFKRATPLIGG